MKFPVIVRHRKTEAVVYGKSKAYPYYRLAYRAAGKRIIRSFATYAEAHKEAEAKVRELAAGNQSAALSAKEVADALAIRDAIAAFRRDTGRSLTALQAVTNYMDSARLLPTNCTVTQAVQGYLQTVAVVRRKPLKEAVQEFCEARKPKAVAAPGKRPALHPTYVKDTCRWLNEFADTFPGHTVVDLTKDHLNAYIGAHTKLSAKSRNDRRAIVRMFLDWCARHDYLPVQHRLFEADGLRKEVSDAAPIDYYRPGELRALLEQSDGTLRAVIALQGLAGLRMEEVFRLDWREVFGIPGHVEITSAKSKTRQRRLVEICTALMQWLAPYNGMEGKVTAQWQGLSGYVQAFMKLRESLKIPPRRNGLRHGYVTHHFAAHQNENLTSALAGNSPAMIHQHYKGLATKAEGEKWFNVLPARPDNVVILEQQATA
jgi:integrase